MANYENKLSEWFRDVEKRAREVAKKKSGDSDQADQAAAAADPQPRAVDVGGPAREAPSSVIAEVETRRLVANTAVALDEETGTGNPRPVGEARASEPVLFEDSDVPQVEDFLDFLRKSTSEAPVSEPEPAPFDIPENQGTLTFAEGTGEPRPIRAEPVSEPEPVVRAPEPPKMQAPAPVEFVAEPEPVKDIAEAAPASVPAPRPAPQPAPAASVEPISAEERWDRLPHHLQTLFAGESDEVAQHSYKTFRESRAELIERLLDPVISLEEAARVLNVCPTTVRRYTNRGALRCLRTAGNQRRFKLSDVLSFMETNQHSRGASVDEAEA